MIHRRDCLLRLGQLGCGALALPRLLAGEASPLGRKNPARSSILIYLWGGPPQQDLWDLKPKAPEGIRSQFAPIATNVPGIELCDQLPRLARHADKFALIRSLSHDSNLHEASVYRTLTGRKNPTLVVPKNQRNRQDFPTVGSVVSYFADPGPLPACVTIPRPIGHDGVTYSGTYAGFLGAAHDPLELEAAKETANQPEHCLSLPQGLDAARMVARAGLLQRLEAEQRFIEKAAVTRPVEAMRERAYAMLVSPEAKQAFRLDAEPDALRDRYGRNEYGEAFLLARRLVEAGVRLVTVVWMYICPDGNVANVWDNHGGTGSLGGITGFAMLKEKYCLPPLDQGLSALLEDLTERGMLDETLVAAYGEFGRTPQINATSGREHWGMCQTALLAGGGIQGGQVYGSSDKHAAYPKDNPVSPEDLLATMYHALGLSSDTEIRDPENRPHRLVEGKAIEALF